MGSSGKSFTDMYTGKKYRVIRKFKDTRSMNRFLDDKQKLKELQRKNGGGGLRYDMQDRELRIEVKQKKSEPKTSPRKRFISIAKKKFGGETFYLGKTSDSRSEVKKSAEDLRKKGMNARVVEIPKTMRNWQRSTGHRSNRYAVYWRKGRKV